MLRSFASAIEVTEYIFLPITSNPIESLINPQLFVRGVKDDAPLSVANHTLPDRSAMIALMRLPTSGLFASVKMIHGGPGGAGSPMSPLHEVRMSGKSASKMAL
jgi:hypothetical protein